MSGLTDPRTGRPRSGPDPIPNDDVYHYVSAARKAQPRWGSLPPGQRSARLLALAQRLDEGSELLAAAEQLSTGKPHDDAVREVEAAIDVLRFFAGAARTQLTPAAGHLIPGRESWVRNEPIGVVAAIVPWNYPLLMAMWRVAPALAAGNTVILKPAETTPDTAMLLAAYSFDTLGGGILATVHGDRETGRVLVRTSVDAIAFTGSAAAAADVAARAGHRPRLSFELGGNAPALVLPDAPGYTYCELVDAVTYNAGQSCAAPARVITLRENYRDTVERLGAQVKDRAAGVHFGPLNNPEQAERYGRLLALTKANTIHTGPQEPRSGETGGYWVPAIIAADLDPADPLVQHEVFGPCLTVQCADSIPGMIELANSVPQALAASVWTTSTTHALNLAQSVDAGEVWVNCHLNQTPELPHGGRRASGNGTDLSVLALAEYQRPKTITARSSLRSVLVGSPAAAAVHWEANA